ncbi:hypothetical protein [uncultured Erythrobacter sp.]|uniref:hypothetical protein n=1 Tax=uncultured Erythrobacter sp. TaxID=263913 RepID=UPI002604F34A|nr:hypothetical protein [uncultured Erythrobacter sp.]
MKKALISATLLALLASSTTAFGSGTRPRGGTDFGWGKETMRGTNSNISNERRLITRGRTQVRRHITCKSCEYHNNLNRETAREVARAVRAGRFDIKDNRRNAVLAYLIERYGI